MLKNTGLQGSTFSDPRMTMGFGPFELPTCGSIEGCCGFPIWQGWQTLSVPACSELVHLMMWHVMSISSCNLYKVKRCHKLNWVATLNIIHKTSPTKFQILPTSLFTLVLYPDYLIYKGHSPHQLPLHVHSARNSEVNTTLEELSN